MEDPPPAPALIGCQGLEQFLLLAKTAKGPAVCELIKQTLEAPGVYVFGELLETECVKELASGTHANYVQLLEIFAFGTYRDYKSKRTMTVLQHSKTRQTKFIVLHWCLLTTRPAPLNCYYCLPNNVTPSFNGCSAIDLLSVYSIC